MKIIRNAKLIRITATVLLGYIVFQVLLYTFLHKKSNIDKITATDAENPKESTSYRNIEEFVTSSHQHGIPLILIDPDVLYKVVNITAQSVKKCYFFCNTQYVIVFGVQSQLWSHNEMFLSSLEKKGFSVNYTIESDTDALRYLSLPHKTIYTHYVLHRSGHCIHVVILYERSAGYWWYGKLKGSILNGDIHVPSLHEVILDKDFTREGIVDSQEIIKVTMDGMKLRAPRYPLPFLQQIAHSTFIHCNYTKAKKFFALYGTPESDAQPFREAATLILSQAKKTLDYIGIPFWLSSGTCLGWYRQCDTIPYSVDVDIGIWIKDYTNLLIPAMHNAHLHLKHLFGKESDSYELSFHNGEMKLDIFFFYEDNNLMWNGGTQTKTGKKFKYIFPKFTLCWTEFLGMKLRIPCDPNSYINANYGENWFEPVKTWDWKKSPPNVKDNGQWPENEWNKVMITFD